MRHFANRTLPFDLFCSYQYKVNQLYTATAANDIQCKVRNLFGLTLGSTIERRTVETENV
jgi:hypothetical protein